MAATKGTSKAKAKAASVAASDTGTTTENGASAPSSLESGVVGQLPTAGAVDANSDKGETGNDSGDGESSGDASGTGTPATGGEGGDLAAGGGDGGGDRSDETGGDDAADPGAADSGNGGINGPGDDGGAGAGGGLESPASLTGESPPAATGADLEQNAQAAALQALTTGGVGDALLSLLAGAETAQTTAENGPAEPVISTVWAMPEIGTFPARVSIQNNSPSRVGVLGQRLEPYSRIEGWVDEDSYARLSTTLASRARLGKWDNLQGVQVKHDSED